VNEQPIHLTKLMANEASKFIEKYGDGEKPFCLSVSFKAPHVQEDQNSQTPTFPFDTEYANILSDAQINRPTSYVDTGFPDLFIRDKYGIANEGFIRAKDRFGTDEKYQESVKGYYRLIKGLDDAVGDIVQTLKNEKLIDNTVIIFLGDNGFYLSEHGLAGKWFGHNESIRIPMIIYDPTNRNETTRDEIALNIDIAPTILDFAKVAKPKRIQGESLKALMKDDANGWRTDFLYEHLMNLQKSKGWYVYIPQTEGVVSKQYKYMRYFLENNREEPFYEQFFDVGNDYFEMHNLVKDSNQEVSAYKRRLKKLISSTE
ncbi:MAG: sulfatase/phosphatase domain-containing protein, partial [Bacteroidales bacterium]